MTIDALATRASRSVDRGWRRSAMYARSARSALYACVGTTVIAWPKRFAMLLETTTHVRIFRGSAPTDGSQQIHRMSPRTIGGSGGASPRGWARPCSRFFFIQQLQLCDLEVLQQLTGIAPACRIVAR